MPKPSPSNTTQTDSAPDARQLAVVLARAITDAKCEEVVVIDVRGLSQISDYIVIGSGTSERQMRTAAEDAEETAEAMGERIFGRSQDANAQWLVVDLVDVVVHLFEPAARAHYDLESLWGDGPRVRWRREEREGADGPAPGADGEEREP